MCTGLGSYMLLASTVRTKSSLLVQDGLLTVPSHARSATLLTFLSHALRSYFPTFSSICAFAAFKGTSFVNSW